MAWNIDTIDTPANVTTALGVYLNTLVGVERSFFNTVRTSINLQLTQVQTAKVRVQTTGDFDGDRWRAQILIDPVLVDPANNIIGTP